jgi:hypothetical protein
MQADHQAGRQPGPADALAVERVEGGGEALPVDQAGQAHQGMAAIDEVHQGRAEEFGLLGRRRYGGIGGLLRGDAPTESRRATAFNSRVFARFSPAPGRGLAIANTYESQKAEESPGLRRCSRLTCLQLFAAVQRPGGQALRLQDVPAVGGARE